VPFLHRSGDNAGGQALGRQRPHVRQGRLLHRVRFQPCRAAGADLAEALGKLNRWPLATAPRFYPPKRWTTAWADGGEPV
jgi:hypothetical protein